MSQEKTLIKIVHSSARGTSTEVELLGFDSRRATMLARYGLAGPCEFSLANGQGEACAQNWLLADLDAVRAMAEREGYPLPAKQRALKRKSSSVRRAIMARLQGNAERRQVALFGEGDR